MIFLTNEHIRQVLDMPACLEAMEDAYKELNAERAGFRPRIDFIVLNNKETAITNQQRELLDLIDERKFGWDKVCELGEVLIGKHPGLTAKLAGGLWSHPIVIPAQMDSR